MNVIVSEMMIVDRVMLAGMAVIKFFLIKDGFKEKDIAIMARLHG